MNHRFMMYGKSIALLLTLLVFDPALWRMAQTAVLAAELPPTIVITEGKTAQGFPYLSGGVGSDERLVLEERGKAFNVKLVFAEVGGSYLADVKLEIVGMKNEAILSTTSAGPWFYIQLPPGTYSVKATFAGKIKTTALRVTKDKRERHVFVWDTGESEKAAPTPRP